MAGNTSIEWCDATWNPVRGCSRISEGCRNCYAEGVAARFSGPGQAFEGFADRARAGSKWTGRVEPINDALPWPLSVTAPKRIFVNSMSDLFHEELGDEAIDAVFGVMALAHRHTFIVLTKRAQRMHDWATRTRERGAVAECLAAAGVAAPAVFRRPLDAAGAEWLAKRGWPLPNVIMGVSVENQPTANERIPLLLATPAARRAISAEPLLAPVTLRPWLRNDTPGGSYMHGNGLHWVIAGGESGPNARPCHPDWIRQLRDQCRDAEVPFFFKQWGEWLEHEHALDALGDDDKRLSDGQARLRKAQRGRLDSFGGVTMVRVGKRDAGAMLDGREHREFPR